MAAKEIVCVGPSTGLLCLQQTSLSGGHNPLIFTASCYMDDSSCLWCSGTGARFGENLAAEIPLQNLSCQP